MKLHKNPFSLEEIINEIQTDGPRGAILLSCSLMEALLIGVIKTKMVKLTNREQDELFEGANAPLSTFSAKIKTAYALGCYGPRTRHDLETLRKIRNPF